jgi:hypothetical protein
VLEIDYVSTLLGTTSDLLMMSSDLGLPNLKCLDCA